MLEYWTSLDICCSVSRRIGKSFFNMGERHLEIYLPKEATQTVIDVSKSFGIDAKIIERVEKNASEGKKLTISSAHGEFV